MFRNAAKAAVHRILAAANITPNGSRLWDIRVHNEKFYARVLREGSLGVGESYMDGWWDAERLDEFFAHVRGAELERRVRIPWHVAARYVAHRLINPQRRSRAFHIGEHHYDIGNDVYQAMLDKRLTYTCGYWKNASSLDEAQEAKLDLVCRKLGLRKGQNVLDIGCGWGSFLKFAAERYDVHGVGVTVSKEQVELGRTLTAGLPVEIQLKDYRSVGGTYDHIVSLGMFEHVGPKNYEEFMKIVATHLKPGGLFLLHTIGQNASNYPTDPWFEKYIFPNSMLPSAEQIGNATAQFFVMEDWQNFSAYYDPTLMAWFANFDRNWRRLEPKYGPRFYRMWKYYLLSSAGAFRARKLQLWQTVFSKSGVPSGYEAVR